MNTCKLTLDPTNWLGVDYYSDEEVIGCVSYHPTQLSMLEADCAKYGVEVPLQEILGETEAGVPITIESWVASYIPEPPVPLTMQDFDSALTAHLDNTARSRKYDNRVTCALRAGYPGPFQAEGQAFAQWMDACNAFAYQLLAEVEAGNTPAPQTVEEFISSLPVISWPT